MGFGFTQSCAIPYTLCSRVKQVYRMGGTKWLEADDPNENHGSQRKRRPACRVSHRSESWRHPRSRSLGRSGSPRKKTSSKTAIIGYEKGADCSLPPSFNRIECNTPDPSPSQQGKLHQGGLLFCWLLVFTLRIGGSLRLRLAFLFRGRENRSETVSISAARQEPLDDARRRIARIGAE